MEFALVLLVGMTIGYFAKGITINITHKQDVDNTPSDMKYNSSYGDPEVKQYLDQHYKVGE